MNHVTFRASCPESLTTNPIQNTGAGTRSNEAGHPAKRYFDNLDISGTPDPRLLVKRNCHSAVSDQAAYHSSCKRELLGGKGMFLWRMKAAGLSVPPFECVTAQIMNALEQHPLDTHRLDHYLPGFVAEPLAKTSLKNLREYLNTLPPSEQTKRDDWLSGMATFIASDDFYERVKDSEAARKIRELYRQVDRLSASQPVIVRSSGINEDNYGDAQAGKYLSVIQAGGDVFRTCLKVMASGYRPEVCPEGIPQPMALIIQQCIDCRYGGVIMSFQSFQNDTVRIEYTKGQPRGVVAGQSGNTPHRIDIYHKEGAEHFQYFPGKVSSHFALHKNNNGYLETEIYDADDQSDDSIHKLSDHLVVKLSQAVTELENLLLCPVDVEFAIDHQGNLFLLQVRPVTRLSGGMDFAMPIPKKTLTVGQGVSEGHCTGTLWQAEEQAADSMPEGAIVVAQHAADWMLEPEFLKRAGGFVFAEGGFNDHVAIVMKQEGKTLMLAGGQFAVVAAQVCQQATLAFARFKGKPGAFIVAGDLSGKLASHRSLSSAFSDVPLTGAVPSRSDLSPPEGTFLNIASGFQWLTDQNARLLAFFASGGGLDCLANPIKLSMSPQRAELLAEIRVRVNRLVQGAEAFLDGYHAFLQLGRSSVRPLQDEARQLIKRFMTVKESVLSGLEAIMLPLKAAEKRQGSFRQWVTDCQQLQSVLQSLNLKEAEQFRSIHELIFALHQRFVNALAPIALDSVQGRVSRVKKITYVDCTTPSDKVSLLRPSDRSSIENSGSTGTVFSMDSATIVNLKLGVHLCLIELLENAEGGKGRTLRLKFSDQFDGNDGVDVSAKLKRMWFLVQLLKAIELNKNAGGMKVSCNAIAGEIVVECPRMKLHQTMQHAFEKLMIALDSMYNLDRHLEDLRIFEGDQWDFNLLAQRLNRDVATAADRFAFQHCLFSMFYRGGFRISSECCQLLSNRLQQFVRWARQLGSCDSLVFQRKKTVDSLREMFLNDEIAEDIRWEFLHHYVLLHPEYAVRVVELVFGYKNHYFVINPSFSYKLEFYLLPVQPLSVNKEKLNNVLREHGPKYASQRAKNHYSAYFWR
ncbi:PEP/pyruvate-binding domain-containing protein [Endozoicomonas sp. 2B-B]